MNIKQRLYALFIAPKQRDEDVRNRELVLNVLLASTLLMLSLGLILLLVDWTILRFTSAGSRLPALVIATSGVGALYGLVRRGFYRFSASLLVIIYFVLAAGVTYRWGVTIPTGPLLLGLVIVLAGILLGPAYSLYAALASGSLLTILQLLAENGFINPDWSWTLQPPTMGDVAGFCLLFALIALVIWLFNNQMERSLKRARRAEKALIRQKGLLETAVEKRTRELQDAQLEKIQQMYRFAELGQLSTALLHDLANHLTTLTLDIEGLEEQSRSRMLQRAKRSIRYIDDMVLRVRDQLHGRSIARSFNVITEMNEVMQIMGHKAQTHHVTLAWEPRGNRKMLRLNGEPVKFRQLMTNLTSNAIDAYVDSAGAHRGVLVAAEAINDFVVVTVNDWGKGIPKADRAQLFEPFYSTKKTGMGMGLFIAKQIVEDHFGGNITVGDSTEHTTLIVRLRKG